MSAAKNTAAARKGDMVLVETVRRDYVIGQGSSETTAYDFGVVVSATREGLVKTWRAIGWGDDLLSDGAQPIRHSRCFVAAKDTVDLEATLKAAKAHHWPGHPNQPRSFDSLAEAKAIVRRPQLAAMPF